MVHLGSHPTARKSKKGFLKLGVYTPFWGGAPYNEEDSLLGSILVSHCPNPKPLTLNLPGLVDGHANAECRELTGPYKVPNHPYGLGFRV